MSQEDLYLNELYDALYNTRMQQKFRKIRPMPVGVVFIQWPGMGWEDMRTHLRLMKQLGYNCLKGFILLPGFDQRRFMHLALDEGIIPWWYGEAGWEDIDEKLLDKLGIPRDTPIEALRQNETFLRYQEGVMRARIDRSSTSQGINERKPKKQEKWTFQAEHELRSTSVRIEDDAVAEFITWLKAKYGTLDRLKEAWNAWHPGLSGYEWQTWEQAVESVRPIRKDRGYNRLKDVIRFKTEVFLRQVRERVDAELAHDPQAPTRAGGEISLFLPVTGRGVDMEGVARLMADRGSLYPSTHPAWHFDRVNYELVRPLYVYSSFMVDVFKGGWTATWESTGGPQHFSGDKGWSPEAERTLPGFTIDAGVMTQFMLTYLAAGYRGFGFWCWSARTAGHEGGEYSLLDRNNQPGPRAIQVGRIGQAAVRLRDELWQAHKQPLVGVFFDPENEIQWSVMADSGRDFLADIPVRARVGVGRALINANIPWEHVTADNLRKGLGGRYKVIYLPAMLTLTSDIFEVLDRYVEQGGRLVMDMPSAYFDEYARITNTGKGSIFERIFGCTIDDYQFASNVPRALSGLPLKGFVVDMTVTQARVLDCYDNGLPAVTEHPFGRGQAVILGYEASLMCFQPGNLRAEQFLIRYLMGHYRSPYRCDLAIVYRINAPQADHYFLINDRPVTKALLEIYDQEYSYLEDAISGERLNSSEPISIDAYHGRWLRFVKR